MDKGGLGDNRVRRAEELVRLGKGVSLLPKVPLPTFSSLPVTYISSPFLPFPKASSLYIPSWELVPGV